MENCVSVTQLNKYIKNIFDAEEMLHGISVFGEISSYNVSNGIAYFNLKDEDNLLSCVLFGANKFQTPKLGDMVLATGSINYWVKGGRLTFQASKIVPYGKGLLYEKFLQLKANLEEKGYFDPAHKKAIPPYVRRIGVVTSATGAVIQDIRDVTTRRNNGVDIVLYPVKVQGVGAEVEIAEGINFFSTYDKVDVVIVARGGGSLEDLQPFNTEIVADATYNCQKPIISAVGHETDFTIIDFVSDLRAPTPSAAAELAVFKKDDVIDGIHKQINRMEKCLDIMANNITTTVQRCVLVAEHFVENKINYYKTDLAKWFNNTEQLLSKKITDYEMQVKLLNNVVEKLNPQNLLVRGYTKLSVNGKPVMCVGDVKIGDVINIRLQDGKLDATVNVVDGGK